MHVSINEHVNLERELIREKISKLFLKKNGTNYLIALESSKLHVKFQSNYLPKIILKFHILNFLTLCLTF